MTFPHDGNLTTADIDRVVAEYDRIVRQNDAVKAVAEDELGEPYWEILDTAIELGFALTDDDMQKLGAAVNSYQSRLRAEIGTSK